MKDNNKTNVMWKSVDVVKGCLKGLMNSIPSDYCWKDKKYWTGSAPEGLNCPTDEGWFEKLKMCNEPCDEGDKWLSLGVCLSSTPCKEGYTDLGLTCKKVTKWWKPWEGDWYEKTYSRKFYTYFNEKAGCPEDKFKFLARCYKSCEPIGMKNCGMFACSSATYECGTAVGKMTARTIVGVAEELLETVEVVVTKVVSKAMEVEAIRNFVKDA